MTNRRQPGAATLSHRDFNLLFRLFSESGLAAALIEGAGLADCRISGVNQRLEELSGHPAAELRSLELDELLAPGDMLRLLNAYIANPQSDAPVPGLPITLLRPDGGGLPVEATLSRLRSECAVSFILTLRDISGQRRLEASLRRQERLAAMLSNLDRLLDHTGDLRQTVHVSLDLTMELLAMETGAFYLNRSSGLRQACARDPDEILPKSLPRRLLAMEGVKRWILHNPDGVPEQASLGLALREDSQVRCLLLQPFAVEKGEPLGMVAVACRKVRQLNPELLEQLDHLELRITRALHNALLIERLAESEAKYRAVLNNTAAGFALFRGNRLLEMNPSFERIMRQFTVQPAEVEAGLLFPENCPLDQVPEGDIWEKELAAPDGQNRWLTVSRSQIDLPGRLFALFVRDHTERKQWESFKILSERLSASGSLAAGLAHEINNPLQAVSTNLGLLTRAFTPGRREQELLDGIYSGLKNVRETVRQLQEIHSTGRTPKRRIQVNQVLRRTLSLSAGQLERNGVIVQASLATRLPTVRGSSASLQRAFLNFMLNACEAMPQGGTLHVHTYFHRGSIYVRFTDTGVGIPPERLNQIFDAFYTTKNKSRGSGLGLAIALNLLRQHDGEVYVKSRPGFGTSFTVKLPLED